MQHEVSVALFRSIDRTAVALGHSRSLDEPPVYVSTSSFDLTVVHASQDGLHGLTLGFNNRTVVEFPAEFSLDVIGADSFIISVRETQYFTWKNVI